MCCALALLACQSAVAADAKRVMILHSFGRDFKPWSAYARTIREELEQQTRWPLDTMDQVLASARLSGDDLEGPFINYLEQLYAARPLDLVITIGAPAGNFVLRHRHKLFPRTPVLLAAVNQRRVPTAAMTENDTAVAVNIDHLAAFESMLRVLPATKNVIVMIGGSPSEKSLREALARDLKPLEGRIKLEWTDNLSFEDVLKSAAALPAHSAVYWYNYSTDAAGVGHEGDRALARFHAVANAPIFSYADAYFGRELLGGPMLSVAEGGSQTASVAVRILGGEKAGDIKTPASQFATPKYDWRELQRWGISESSLPPSSQIYFREPGLWEQYRLPILGIFAALLVQSGMIGWLVYEHRRRTRAEMLARASMFDLTYRNRLASAGELSASIAHEVNQPLSGIVLKASAALRWMKAEKPDMNKIEGILSDIVSAGQRAGDIVVGIRAMFKKDANAKVAINLNNLINTVLALVRLDLQKEGVRVDTQLDQQLPSVIGDPVQLQQVILNLILNAADAMRMVERRELKVQSSASASGVVHVSIEDSGKGVSVSDLHRIFDPLFTTKSSGMGMGLSICRTIIEAHGGKISVLAGAERGAIFQFELPEADAAEPRAQQAA
jgi:signal transduction histidine kinase